MAIKYGYLEARIYLPAGHGLWPAFWTIGSDVATGTSWPTTGEIDVMESANKMASMFGAIHGPVAQTGSPYVAYTPGAPVPGTLAGAWHIYAMNWTPSAITWYLDGVAYGTITKSSLPAGDVWEFDKPHLIQLNLAVGGDTPGSPDATTVFPATMLVDYVRYYSN